MAFVSPALEGSPKIDRKGGTLILSSLPEDPVSLPAQVKNPTDSCCGCGVCCLPFCGKSKNWETRHGCQPSGGYCRKAAVRIGKTGTDGRRVADVGRYYFGWFSFWVPCNTIQNGLPSKKGFRICRVLLSWLQKGAISAGNTFKLFLGDK